MVIVLPPFMAMLQLYLIAAKLDKVGFIEDISWDVLLIPLYITELIVLSMGGLIVYFVVGHDVAPTSKLKIVLMYFTILIPVVGSSILVAWCESFYKSHNDAIREHATAIILSPFAVGYLWLLRTFLQCNNLKLTTAAFMSKHLNCIFVSVAVITFVLVLEFIVSLHVLISLILL